MCILHPDLCIIGCSRIAFEGHERVHFPQMPQKSGIQECRWVSVKGKLLIRVNIAPILCPNPNSVVELTQETIYHKFQKTF